MSTTKDVLALLADSDFAALLRASELVDHEYYRAAAGLPDLRDPPAHYAEVGWRMGLRPNARFDGDFLAPFYESAGFLDQPPAGVWLELTSTGYSLPANTKEAQTLAERLRDSPFFDPAYYAAHLPAGMDPAIHYVVVGERMGWRPSLHFDPAYYVERYADVAEANAPPLAHFESNGKSEGRQPSSVLDRLTFTPVSGHIKPVVLVISHQASRTGAPVLSWNLIRLLAKSATVISLLLRGGKLENEFVAVAASSVGPATSGDWHSADAYRLAKRITSEFRPTYAIANSFESHIMVPALAACGIPSIALAHEFAAYTRPINMRNVLEWATHVVFPAQIVAQSLYDRFPGLEQRPGIHIVSQGPNEPPPLQAVQNDLKFADESLLDILRPKGTENAFLVLGAGTVEYRKGVDLFICAAGAARKIRPDIQFRFVWIGDDDPKHEKQYSDYLAYQIAHSDLGSCFAMIPSVANLDQAYAAADAFFISSRLDPQPNVGIDAVIRGIPIVCFDGACGTAETLKADSETRRLIAPHLDSHGAAAILCDLAANPEKTSALRAALARVGRSAYDMTEYVKKIERWGQSSAAAIHVEDFDTLVGAAIVDPDMAQIPRAMPADEFALEWQVILQWSIMGLSLNPNANPQFRRPCAGFHPQIYAQANPKECGPGQANPLAHWVRAGQPKGPWTRDCFTPSDLRKIALVPQKSQRIALHGHFYHESLALEFADRLQSNTTPCDLFLSTDTKAKASHLTRTFCNHRGTVEVMIVPNQGRDIGPLLTAYSSRLAHGGYDIVGHFHAKKSLDTKESLDTNAVRGDGWRYFLWETLVGGEYAMLDLAAAVFASKPSVGLLMAEDPHLVGWGENRAIAEALAKRIGIRIPVADFFDFPLGAMFWYRPDALKPLFELGLRWEDYPSEPVPNDGTILHAIERLIPFVVNESGYDVCSLRVPGVSWW
jgi:glycosyltransferase involved in cell wall biosynthesis